ncbi:MAG: hypothetical protein M3279_13025 [Actinomycetota bacterium]|nr:hypothetical protein [Actinomycetota bacterium]
MYCPVDGIEWREGITRCPEHDVDLVDEPPEVAARPSVFDRLRGEGLAGYAAIVVAVAGIVYAVTGVVFNGWAVLAQSREWLPTTPIDAVQFLQSAAWAAGLGTLGCLGAAVLARVHLRLTRPPEPAATDEEADDYPVPEGAWFVPLLATLVACFSALWFALSLWIAWENATSPTGEIFGFTPGDEGALASNLYFFQNAALAGLGGSLATLGALLMARAHDRLSGAA